MKYMKYMLHSRRHFATQADVKINTYMKHDDDLHERKYRTDQDKCVILETISVVKTNVVFSKNKIFLKYSLFDHEKKLVNNVSGQ